VEQELRERLDKVRLAHGMTEYSAPSVILITIETLEAIRAHILEAHSDRQGEIVIADTAIELVKGYR